MTNRKLVVLLGSTPSTFANKLPAALETSQLHFANAKTTGKISNSQLVIRKDWNPCSTPDYRSHTLAWYDYNASMAYSPDRVGA